MDHQVHLGQDDGNDLQLQTPVVGPTHRSPWLPSVVAMAAGSVVLMTSRAWARPIRCLRLDCVQARSAPDYYRTYKWQSATPGTSAAAWARSS